MVPFIITRLRNKKLGQPPCYHKATNKAIITERIQPATPSTTDVANEGGSVGVAPGVCVAPSTLIGEVGQRRFSPRLGSGMAQNKPSHSGAELGRISSFHTKGPSTRRVPGGMVHMNGPYSLPPFVSQKLVEFSRKQVPSRQ